MHGNGNFNELEIMKRQQRGRSGALCSRQRDDKSIVRGDISQHCCEPINSA